MKDFICEVSGLKFLIKNSNDHVQKRLVKHNSIYEEYILKHLERYMPKNLVIIDAGAHIGTHSLFWAKYTQAKSIWAFEPQKDIFQILQKNIEINGFENIIHAFNIGLSDKDGKASISATVPNISALTQIKEDANGDIELKSLDTFDFKNEKIDFIKIDTERHEFLILKGGKDLIQKYRPRLLVETSYETDKEVVELIKSYNYKEVAMFPDEYIPFFYNRFFVPN